MLHILDGATTPLLPPSIYVVAGDRVKNMSFFLQIWYDYYLPMTFHARSDKDSHLLFSTLGIHNLTPPRHISPISDNGIHYPGPIDSPIVTNKSKSSTRARKTPYAWCGATPRELLPRLKATKFDLKKMSP